MNWNETPRRGQALTQLDCIPCNRYQCSLSMFNAHHAHCGVAMNF
jgi:hypothetical protein